MDTSTGYNLGWFVELKHFRHARTCSQCHQCGGRQPKEVTLQPTNTNSSYTHFGSPLKSFQLRPRGKWGRREAKKGSSRRWILISFKICLQSFVLKIVSKESLMQPTSDTRLHQDANCESWRNQQWRRCQAEKRSYRRFLIFLLAPVLSSHLNIRPKNQIGNALKQSGQAPPKPQL